MAAERKKETLVGKNMKSIRKAAGMTQQEVAGRMSIDRSVYTKYETGTLTPSLDTIQSFANIMKVRQEQLLRSASVVIPDSSALMKNRRLLSLLMEDFDQVVILSTVIQELDKYKDRRNKGAWQVLMTIEDFRTRYRGRFRIENSEYKEIQTKDDRIIHFAEIESKKVPGKVYILQDDVTISIKYENKLLLRDYMATRGNKSSYRLILDLDEEFDSFSFFSRREDELSESINDYLPDGNTPLISAIRCNEKEKVEKRSGRRIPDSRRKQKIDFIIGSGADIDKNDASRYCLTPIAHCVQMNDYNTFRSLLEKGADYNKGSMDVTNTGYIYTQNEGNTPLMIACWHGRFKYVKALCEQPDISLNQQDSNGYTALIKCAVRTVDLIKKKAEEGEEADCSQFRKCYEYLLSQPGIDTRIRDRKNRTVADWWAEAEKLRKEAKEG